MDANRNQLGVLMGANRDVNVIEVTGKYSDGDLCQVLQKMDLVVPCPNLPSPPHMEEHQQGKGKGVDNYETELENRRPMVECDRNITWTRKSLEKADSKAVIAQSVSEGIQEVKPFDICQSSLGMPLFPESKEETMCGKCVTDYHTRILRPGMVLLKNYMSLDDQAKIVRSCRRLGLGEGGFYQPGYVNDDNLRLQRMYLGRFWDSRTKTYTELRHFDGARPPPVPDSFISLTERAIEAAHVFINAELSEGSAVDILPHMHPNVSIVNFYNTNWGLNLHQDKSESKESIEKGLPVVTICLGDSAIFVYGDNRNITEVEQVLLESGDVLIFGGNSRLIYHGVHSVIPNSAPAALQRATGLRPGRLSVTLREF